MKNAQRRETSMRQFCFYSDRSILRRSVELVECFQNAQKILVTEQTANSKGEFKYISGRSQVQIPARGRAILDRDTSFKSPNRHDGRKFNSRWRVILLKGLINFDMFCEVLAGRKVSKNLLGSIKSIFNYGA